MKLAMAEKPASEGGGVSNESRLRVSLRERIQKVNSQNQYAEYAKAPPTDTLLHISHTQTLVVETEPRPQSEPELIMISFQPVSESGSGHIHESRIPMQAKRASSIWKRKSRS
jgi:hypothetical protein